MEIHTFDKQCLGEIAGWTGDDRGQRHSIDGF